MYTLSQYLKDRRIILADPRENHSTLLHQSQLEYLHELLLVDCSHYEPRIARSAAQLCFEHAGLGTLFAILGYERDPAHIIRENRSKLAQEILSVNESLRRELLRWVNKIVLTHALDRFDINTFSRYVTICTAAEKVLEVTASERGQLEVATSDTIVTGLGHTTAPRRQADSNQFLLEYYQRHPKACGQGQAIFVGGSIGLTAVDFVRHMQEIEDVEWQVINFDLYSPEAIARRFYKSKEEFKRPSFINYVQGDMTLFDFKEQSYDFIDVCNSTGYIQDINLRLETSRKLWRALRVGGVMRVGSPGYEYVFEQALFKKIGLGFMDYEVIYLSMAGKSAYLRDEPDKALALGKELTQAFVNAHARLTRKPKQDFAEVPIANWKEAVAQDVYYLSPVAFLAGVNSAVCLSFPDFRSGDYDQYIPQLKQALAELAR